MGIEFRILGAVEVEAGGATIDIGHPRQRAVLGVLALEANHLVSIDQLLDRIWGDRSPTRGRETVYNYVSRLRTALRAVDDEVRLDRRSGGYLLAVDERAVDVHRFRALVSQARGVDDDRQAAELFEQALRLWRGEPLAELDTPWATGLRATLDHERTAADLDRIDSALRCGRHAELFPSLSERARQHPLDERLAGQMMLALYRSGRQADALRHYQELRRRLDDELGTEPGPDTQYLHKQILTTDPGLSAPGPRAAASADDATPSTQLDRAVRDLSTAVRRQWTAEAEIRSLHRPAPVRVRWSSTDRPVTDVPGALRGDIFDVAARFRERAIRQLVVLGEPGAGKTVLATLLTLGLLADRAANDPTPVLLSLSTWNPRRDHLHSWLARRLLEDYPGLGNTKAYGRDAATRLATEDRVIPVLDGLDEMAPDLHAAAIDALDRATAGDRPLVVTCRADEYEHAVRRGDILAGAAVVEIETVGLDDAVTFLTAGRRPGDARWRPVLEHLRHHRDGPLARALSTPLMVDLARTTYRDAASDPAELLDRRRFPDRAAVENHLLDAFLPALYARHPRPPGLSPPTVPGYDPDQARRWLTFLAGHLHHLQTRDFAWWRLVRAIPRPVRGLVFSLPAAVLFAVAGLLARGPVAAWVYGLSTAVGGCAAQGWGTRPGPSRVEVRFRGTAGPFLGRAAIGVAISVVIGLLWSLPVGPVAILASAFGIGTGLPVWLETPRADRASSPATTYAQDRVATLAFALSVAVSIGLFYAFAIAVSRPHSNLGAVADPFHFTRALPAGGVSALFGWLAFRSVGAVSYGAAGFVIGGLAMAHHIPLSLGLAAGAVFGLAIGLTTVLSRSWGLYQLSRAWLALRGRTPLQLNRFLQDAHRRGVLRQTGALYQFRHTRLQDRLAGGGDVVR